MVVWSRWIIKCGHWRTLLRTAPPAVRGLSQHIISPPSSPPSPADAVEHYPAFTTITREELRAVLDCQDQEFDGKYRFLKKNCSHYVSWVLDFLWENKKVGVLRRKHEYL